MVNTNMHANFGVPSFYNNSDQCLHTERKAEILKGLTRLLLQKAENQKRAKVVEDKLEKIVNLIYCIDYRDRFL